jgi:regulator of sirC expression with transglutaminase-like and TPR domain
VRWCSRDRPPIDRFMLALAGEFHEVDDAAALERLDDLARPAFGIASLPHEAAAARLIEAIAEGGGMSPGVAGDPDGLMLDRVLASGRGRPELLAAVYLEVARRAGVSLSLLSSGLNWFVGFEEADELVLVAPASFDRPLERIDLRRRCPHALADAVLAGLTDLLEARGAGSEAAHTLVLRRHLRAAQRPDESGRG